MAETLQIHNDERRSAAMASNAAGVSTSSQSHGLSLAALLDLSRELRSLLVAVRPRPEFREELYDHLLVEARRQRVQRMLSLPVESAAVLGKPWTTVHRIPLGYGLSSRRWIIGAAAVGSAASVVGLLAYVRSRRHG
jgi:hypothetical protein